MTDNIIEPARPHDAVAIRRLIHELATAEGRPDDCRITEAQVRGWIEDPKQLLRFYVTRLTSAPKVRLPDTIRIPRRTLLPPPPLLLLPVSSPSQVVAYGCFGLLLHTFDGRLEGHVEDLVVDEAHRGRGHGTAMFRHLLREAKRAGASEVSLGVHKGNLAMMAYYEKVFGAKIETRWRTMTIDLSGDPVAAD